VLSVVKNMVVKSFILNPLCVADECIIAVIEANVYYLMK
jgi:hypothetical protein